MRTANLALFPDKNQKAPKPTKPRSLIAMVYDVLDVWGPQDFDSLYDKLGAVTEGQRRPLRKKVKKALINGRHRGYFEHDGEKGDNKTYRIASGSWWRGHAPVRTSADQPKRPKPARVRVETVPVYPHAWQEVGTFFCGVIIGGALVFLVMW